MPSLFQLPKVQGPPGAKLYFYRTGTSTPQDVYTDEDLQVAHSQPVVADGAGVFAPIYLDQGEFSYRVTYTTSADVLIYTVDDIPNNLGDGRNLTIASVTPFVELFDTDGPSNAKRAQIRQQGGDFEFVILDDAGGVTTSVFKVFRSGVNPDEMRFLCDNLTAVVDGDQYDVALSNNGSFTGTVTGMTANPTGTIYYRKISNVVTMWSQSNITATSNSTAMTLTGLPALIQPVAQKIVSCSELVDSGNPFIGFASINGASVTFGRAEVSGSFVRSDGVFTNSGTKGIGSGWTITYTVD